MSQASDIQRLCIRTRLCYLSYIPPAHECGTRPFFRWVRSQDRSPHASGKAKNTVSIPLTRLSLYGISCTPHLTGKCGTRPFLGGSGCRARAHTRPARPKIPSAFPLRTCRSTYFSDWPIYISTTSGPVNSSSAINFNTCVYWPEIRVQVTADVIGTLFYITFPLLIWLPLESILWSLYLFRVGSTLKCSVVFLFLLPFRCGSIISFGVGMSKVSYSTGYFLPGTFQISVSTS